MCISLSHQLLFAQAVTKKILLLYAKKQPETKDKMEFWKIDCRKAWTHNLMANWINGAVKMSTQH